jgi:ribosomal protein S18 acetylase RimI-like enzyme
VVPPAYFNHEVTVRALQSESDWAQALENQVSCRGDDYEETGYRVYKERAMSEYRRLQGLGRGAWFGAFLGEKLVADCGLFFESNLGRFQSVGTHPDFRRLGICQTMVHVVARHGLDVWNLETLVIVAEDDQPAGRIYGSLGFRATEKQVSLYRHDK